MPANPMRLIALPRPPGGGVNYIYEDAGSKWRWRAKASNRQTIASSGESFANKQNAQQAADNVKENAGKADGP